jgi:hypothetical protein
MPKPAAVTVVTKLVALLTPLEAAERTRVIDATLMLLGEQPRGDQGAGGGAGGGAGAGAGATGGGAGDASVRQGEQVYFNGKKPKTKGEELAVAARFRELRFRATSSTGAEIQATITAARRDLDVKNFRRDLDNARRLAGLFATGTGKDAITLSAFGQQYVDTLPNREALKSLERDGRKKRKKASKKAKAKA